MLPTGDRALPLGALRFLRAMRQRTETVRTLRTGSMSKRRGCFGAVCTSAHHAALCRPKGFFIYFASFWKLCRRIRLKIVEFCCPSPPGEGGLKYILIDGYPAAVLVPPRPGRVDRNMKESLFRRSTEVPPIREGGLKYGLENVPGAFGPSFLLLGRPDRTVAIPTPVSTPTANQCRPIASPRSRQECRTAAAPATPARCAR